MLSVECLSNDQAIQPPTLVSSDLLSVLKDLLDVQDKSCPATRVFREVFTNPKSTNDWRERVSGPIGDVKPKGVVKDNKSQVNM